MGVIYNQSDEWQGKQNGNEDGDDDDDDGNLYYSVFQKNSS